VVVRGQAYGIRAIRVDGNDTLAVYSAVHAAREMAITEGRPVSVEVHNGSARLHQLKQQNFRIQIIWILANDHFSGTDLSSWPSLDIRWFNQVQAGWRDPALANSKGSDFQVPKVGSGERLVVWRWRVWTQEKSETTGNNVFAAQRFIFLLYCDAWHLKTQPPLQILQAIQVAERAAKPPVHELFTDVYDQVPSNLREQEQELRDTIMKHPADYPADVPI
jgi:2-oxoisovalerate dehydrogenase E1 component alpha subunit